MTLSRAIVYSSCLMLLLSVIAFSINFFGTDYPGNNYLPINILVLEINLVLIYLGLNIQFDKNHKILKIAKELIFIFSITALIALATNAIQYTPFTPIDTKILALEKSIALDLSTIISWTYTKPNFKLLLELLYDSLLYQMIIFPLLLIIKMRISYLREYYFLLLISALIGFSFYYFFPTTAPASVINNEFFTENQRATGLKFMQIHQHITPTTPAGGMISLPSFHAIWSWFCLYLIRSWPLLLIIMIPVNILIISSCVLLGWHYPLDILGSLVIILSSHALYYFILKKHAKAYNLMSITRPLSSLHQP